jgi:hypothetical protein
MRNAIAKATAKIRIKALILQRSAPRIFSLWVRQLGFGEFLTIY